jgi:Phosphotriesterase family
MILAMIVVPCSWRTKLKTRQILTTRGLAQSAAMNYSRRMPTMPSRRDILRLIGASAAAAFAHSLGATEERVRFPSGAVIRTVLKDLPPEALAGGATLFHEHLSVGADFMPKVMAQFRILLGPDAMLPPLPPPEQQRLLRDLGVMTEEMRSAAAAGVACIVDAGHPDMGRNFQFLRQLSLKSGMPIVAGAGYYTQPFYPPEIARWDEDEIAQELLRQVKAEAIGAYGEIGTWDAMTPDERKVFRAVGKAHLATNLPIFTHTNMGKGALEQLDVLESVGPNASPSGIWAALRIPTLESKRRYASGAHLSASTVRAGLKTRITCRLSWRCWKPATRRSSCSRPISPSPQISSTAAAPGMR